MSFLVGDDMSKDFAKTFYKSTVWQRCRNVYIAERIKVDGGMCEICHKRLGYIVHHKKMLTQSNINNPEVSINHSNLQYVCKDCHDKFEGHGVGKSKYKLKVLFDDNGQPIPKGDTPP